MSNRPACAESAGGVSVFSILAEVLANSGVHRQPRYCRIGRGRASRITRMRRKHTRIFFMFEIRGVSAVSAASAIPAQGSSREESPAMKRLDDAADYQHDSHTRD